MQGIITLIAVSIIVFFSSRLTGDPVSILLGPDATPKQIELLTEKLGLDKPVIVQYGNWISNVFKGDFGTSIRYSIPVFHIIMQRLPNSLVLAALGLLIAVALAVPLAILSAVRRGTILDSIVRAIGVLGMATPSFLLGIFLILIFSVGLHLFPAGGKGGPATYIMPAFTLGFCLAGGIMRLLRSNLLETLDSDYVKFARIKGLPEWIVLTKHATRNALVPVVTFGGYYIALAIGAAVVTETVFAWPGLARLTYESVLWRDFPVMQGAIITISVIVIITNIAVDIIYAYLDPRIRY